MVIKMTESKFIKESENIDYQRVYSLEERSRMWSPDWKDENRCNPRKVKYFTFGSGNPQVLGIIYKPDDEHEDYSAEIYSNRFEETLDLADNFKTENEAKSWVENWFTDYPDFNESLKSITEAANPDNAELNMKIAKTLATKSSVSKYVSEQMKRNPEEDGWPGIVKDITDKVLSRASTIKYEIDNCVRGAYISGTTIDDLIKSLRYLKNDLIDAIDQLQADARHINESIDCETIEDIDNFISDVKSRFPGSEAIYDGDTHSIKITLDNVCESTKNNSVTESFDADYSNSEVYQASSIESLNNFATGLGTACKDLKPGLGISVKGYYVERSDDGETYHVWNDLGESKSIKESANTMIYLFPELTDEDLNAAKGYGLQFLGKNHGPDGSEDNWVLKGYESSLRMFADKYLGYELHPDYLYDEEDFAGDIINESLNESTLSISDLKAFYNTSDSIDKDKYPNFFVWYDDMVRSGKYKNESLIESDCRFEENYWTVKPDWDDYCPHCCNRSLVGAGDGRAICDSCNAEYNIEPMPNGRVKIIELEESLTESKQAVKNILQPLVTNGRVRALKSDEKRPRGFAFKSSNGSSGQVSYNGKDYVYAVVDGKLRVMTDVEAGSNWSETIYAKESLTADYTLKIEKDIANLMSESGLNVNYVDCFATRSEAIKLNIKTDNIESVKDLVNSYCENNCLTILSEFNGAFGNIVYTLSKDTDCEVINEPAINEDIKAGDNVKVSTPGNAYYDGRTGIVDYVDDGIATVLFDDGHFPKINNFDITQISRISD